MVDLGNKVLIPGFVDSHSHFPGAGTNRYQVNLEGPPVGPINSLDDAIEALRKKAQVTPKGQWVLGYGYYYYLIGEKRQMTRYDLDKASTDHPILVAPTHLAIVNSLALKMAGITKDTPEAGRRWNH